MKSTLSLIFTGIIFFVICMIAYLPAAQVVNRLELPADIIISGVSGTIWEGKAQQIIVQGLPVKDVQWEISAWSLLLGRIHADVVAGNMRDADEIAFKGPINISLLDLKNINSHDASLYFPVDRVLAEVRLPLPVNAGGRFRVLVDELSFAPHCEQLNASGDWLNATVSGTQGPIDFGEYNAKLTCEGRGISIKVNEPNKLGLSMHAIFNEKFDLISVTGQFKPQPSLPAEVSQAALLFGLPDADGYTRFKL
ncbi:type II secretion system protein N [Alteromonas sp. ASW11-130]|uniref:type II secretion system protein N n=1 Tax=Alteromonas sp. ASW11-130 TaxID=3015775 RepID=UPI0022419622|nr:type II secretion system protein N [Alteromonas sp. ASW11-130]MCW8093278.1 type II secretion system protein N [Alteromonas sp. ASW11-130]